MNDIEKVEGRLFKYYSIIACADQLEAKQIKHFLKLNPYPQFDKNATLEHFQNVLFGPGAKLGYVFEEFDCDVPGASRLAAYQFSPVYARRIALMREAWREKFRTERISVTHVHNRELSEVRRKAYSEGQVSALLAGAREAVEYMSDYSKIHSERKYAPGAIEDIEKWLHDAELGALGTPMEIEALLVHMVERFTQRSALASRFKPAADQ
ncbi:hypothetical protein N7650_13065 [Pseudomonas sp. GD04058]|uniref:hypothetical protein n=1 Tax=Pseudomonas sp. GD04058 TaxID=2975429 RepID=UPI002448B9E8|nr:hypothetical protein [Pseudomonas sp. GD04058]MDG9883770.1 hypothetical protein [Pseudomonas sp. GD04058]